VYTPVRPIPAPLGVAHIGAVTVDNDVPINPRFAVWTTTLGTLTALGVLILHLTGVNQDRDFSPAIVLIGYSASLAAIIATATCPGDFTVRSLLRQVLRWRVDVRWYLVAVLGPAVLVLVSNVVYQLAGGDPHWSTLLDVGAIGGGFGALVAGSLGEELGWRGFAQPLLQHRYSALRAAVIVGAIWATWHLWPLIAPGGSDHFEAANFVQSYVRLISTAVIYAWVYNRTGGSVLLVMLAHAGHNIAIDLMPPANDTVGLVIAFAHLAIAAVIIRVVGPDLGASQRPTWQTHHVKP
jgi:membrane protease YdiL (CAAX protease family)